MDANSENLELSLKNMSKNIEDFPLESTPENEPDKDVLPETEELIKLRKELIDNLKDLDKSLDEKGITLEDWINIVSAIFRRPETLEYIQMRFDNLVSKLPDRENVKANVDELFQKFIEDCKNLKTD